MQFRSRVKGELKFSAKVRGTKGEQREREIGMSFPVKIAQTIQLRPQTVELYQEAIRKVAKLGKIVALDTEAREFLANKDYRAPVVQEQRQDEQE